MRRNARKQGGFSLINGLLALGVLSVIFSAELSALTKKFQADSPAPSTQPQSAQQHKSHYPTALSQSAGPISESGRSTNIGHESDRS